MGRAGGQVGAKPPSWDLLLQTRWPWPCLPAQRPTDLRRVPHANHTAVGACLIGPSPDTLGAPSPHRGSRRPPPRLTPTPEFLQEALSASAFHPAWKPLLTPRREQVRGSDLQLWGPRAGVGAPLSGAERNLPKRLSSPVFRSRQLKPIVRESPQVRGSCPRPEEGDISKQNPSEPGKHSVSLSGGYGFGFGPILLFNTVHIVHVSSTS